MLSKYLVLLRMKYIEMFAYQLATLVWLIGTMVQPLIIMLVWINIYETQTDYFILYFATLIFVERATSAWDVWELDRQIRDGTFSYSIVRPFHPIHWAIAENLVYKALFIVALIPVWLLLAMVVPALKLNLSGPQWLLFIFALFLGAVIRFTISYMFGLFGFWITKVTAIYSMFEAVSLFMSGRIAPLALLPPLLQEVSIYLPFRYMVGFPIDLVTGAAKEADIRTGFLGAFIWTTILG
ncbi:MAG: multidrug transporter permease [Firmicutes bacterium]|nr:multidrug transporter permease [Bacillota bacterium]